MDIPSSKKIGAPRFSGQGRIQAKPGTVKWYKQNIPERFNNIASNVESAGYDKQSAEVIAARILKWNESPQPHINESIFKEQYKLFQKELLQNKYWVEQNDF